MSDHGFSMIVQFFLNLLSKINIQKYQIDEFLSKYYEKNIVQH